MKSKLILLCAGVIFLSCIYGWKCSSSKNLKHRNQEKIHTSSSNAAPIVPEEIKAAAASIAISSAHAVPLYKDIHSACTVDIFFSKGMQPHNILADPYFSFLRSFNFTSLQYSGGSTADHDHVIVGDTKISGGRGDGYNISAADCQARGEDINSILNGIGTVHFGKDFFNEYCALLNKLSIPGDIIANVQGGTLDELLWKIQQSHAERVIFGMEQNLPSNVKDFPDGKAYKEKMVKWIDAVKRAYPNVIIAIDAAPIYRANPKFTSWNDAIREMPGDEVRVYLWDKDALYWQPDQNQNVEAMNQAFTTTYPQWLEQIKQKFPGKKVSVWQWGLKPKTDVFNTMAGCMYIGKFYKFMIDYNKANNNYIGYAAFMSLKSLDRGDGRTLNHALALQACGKLFAGNKRVLDLAIGGVNGVNGIACEENGKYTLLLLNETGNEVNIPSISIDNSTLSGKKFVITSVSSSSLGSSDVSMDTKSLSAISLHPYSINVIEF